MAETISMSKQAMKALFTVNDAGVIAKRVSVSSVRRLMEEWDGDPVAAKVFPAFLQFREAVAEFEAQQQPDA